MLLLRQLHFKMYTLNKDGELIMVKKIAVALLCASLGSTLYARDDISKSRPFVGLEIGYATVQGDVGGFFPNTIERDYEGSDIEYGIRLGAQKEDWRTILSFNYYDSTSDDRAQNYEKYLVAFDYFVLGATESIVKPYIGLNAGYINYESTNNIDMSGFIYGVEAGIVLNAAENVDLDLMYRYSLSNATQDDRDASLDHVGSIVFSVNYLF